MAETSTPKRSAASTREEACARVRPRPRRAFAPRTDFVRASPPNRSHSALGGETMSSTEAARRRRISQKAERFTESVIREMTREALKHGAVNLSQGFPAFAD